MGPAARTSRRTRAPSARARRRGARSSGPTRLDPKTSSMICAQCHSLRNAVDPVTRPATNYYDYFMPRARVRAARRPGPAVLGRRTAAPLLERRDRPVAERVLPARRRDVHDLPQRPPQPDVDRNPQLAAGNNALCTGCHQAIGARLDRAHASPRRQRRQLLRRVPHAEDGDQHQGDDARSHDRACRRPRTPSRSASPTRATDAMPTRMRRGRSPPPWLVAPEWRRQRSWGRHRCSVRAGRQAAAIDELVAMASERACRPDSSRPTRLDTCAPTARPPRAARRFFGRPRRPVTRAYVPSPPLASASKSAPRAPTVPARLTRALDDRDARSPNIGVHLANRRRRWHRERRSAAVLAREAASSWPAGTSTRT